VKRVRWKCPHNEHAGVLGPSKPRKIDLCRYCIDCSLDAGVLVERISPAMEKRRARLIEATAARALKKRERAKQLVKRKYDVNGIDALDVMHELRRLPIFYNLPKADLKLVVHRARKRFKTKLGHCSPSYYGHEIHLYTDPDWGINTLVSTLLHELVHAKTYKALRKKRNKRFDWHGKLFSRTLEKADEQYRASNELADLRSGGRYGMRFARVESKPPPSAEEMQARLQRFHDLHMKRGMVSPGCTVCRALKAASA
jgi:hypothetical protein